MIEKSINFCNIITKRATICMEIPYKYQVLGGVKYRKNGSAIPLGTPITLFFICSRLRVIQSHLAVSVTY